MTYIVGDFWRICDRCGFKYRASQTYRTWDGLFVCHEDFETRHPQDFVRSRKDDQSVLSGRPEQINNLVGPLITHLSAAAATAATTIYVESSVRFLTADRIGIVLSDGNVGRHIINSVPDGTSIVLSTGLAGAASSGAVVINYSAVSDADIG